MNQSRRKHVTTILAIALSVIPLLWLAYYMSNAGGNSMGNMPGMRGGTMPTATAIPPTTGAGRRIRVGGGGYGEVSPGELRQLLATKDFTLINVHIPYEGELAEAWS